MVERVSITCSCVSRGVVFFFFPNDFIYLFMRDTERGRDIDGGRSRLLEGSPMQDSILGPWDHALSHPGIPHGVVFKMK